MNLKLGILGGTFDPPHNGHLLIAREALTQLGLTQVLFAPTRQPPHKNVAEHSAIEHRIEMVRLAIAPYPQFVLSLVDVDRAGPTYTVDTMRLLREQFGDQVELFFIMGMDSLAHILTWRAPEQLIQSCKLAVFARPGFEMNLDTLEQKIPGLRARVVLLNAPALDIAASDLQKRVRAGQSIAHLVPEAVARYIAEKKLYRE
ncbi:MAG: nicotinate-nucleotide adenylyltransferase [Anaerolineales bacterium]|nr:nicotinate-nucleotide adenylyltransferase [Anaerolineales bacterium]